MIQKKICMLGASAVGKTSLVQQFVHGRFSEAYLTTIGVKIDRKPMRVDAREVNLIVWDLNGEDPFQRVSNAYLRGAAGYFLVVDGTRRSTLDAALRLHERLAGELHDLPALLLLNKADLHAKWTLDEARLADLEAGGWSMLRTSARTGTGVEEAFSMLARRLLTPVS